MARAEILKWSSSSELVPSSCALLWPPLSSYRSMGDHSPRGPHMTSGARSAHCLAAENSDTDTFGSALTVVTSGLLIAFQPGPSAPRYGAGRKISTTSRQHSSHANEKFTYHLSASFDNYIPAKYLV